MRRTHNSGNLPPHTPGAFHTTPLSRARVGFSNTLIGHGNGRFPSETPNVYGYDVVIAAGGMKLFCSPRQWKSRFFLSFFFFFKNTYGTPRSAVLLFRLSVNGDTPRKSATTTRVNNYARNIVTVYVISCSLCARTSKTFRRRRNETFFFFTLYKTFLFPCFFFLEKNNILRENRLLERINSPVRNSPGARTVTRARVIAMSGREYTTIF